MTTHPRILHLAPLILAMVSICPRLAGAVECTAQVLFDSRRDYVDIGELSAGVNVSDPPPRHRVGRVEVGLFGIRAYSLCENTAQSQVYLYLPRTRGEFALSNVVFSSTGSTPVPVSLNLDLDGRFDLLDATGNYALGKIEVSATINGTTFPGEIHVCTTSCTQVQLGLLEGLVGRTYPQVRLTTPEVVVPVNQPVSVVISMTLYMGADGTPWSRAEALFENSFSFAHSGPVFNVPAGVNVNSEQSVIVNNAYQEGNSVPTSPNTWSTIKALYR